MNITNEQLEASQAIYTKQTLALYDLTVLAISNRLAWKCPTKRLLKHYKPNGYSESSRCGSRNRLLP